MLKPQNYRWQNRKEYKGKTNLAQSALAARQHPQTTVVGGRARASAKTFFIAAILLRENEDVGIVSFYSVIYNFVPRTYNYTINICAIVESDLSLHGKN